MVARILHRYMKSKVWATLNPSPVLQEGELGIESDTGLIKIGDGITPWEQLDYYTGEGQRYFFQSQALAPKQSVDGNHRGMFAFAYTGRFGKRADRAFMYLNAKTLTRNGEQVDEETACELIPISFFAHVRHQQSQTDIPSED